MGLLGISEGAIPFAATRPAQVIPANMLGGAVAGALAGPAGATDGGPIVAVLARSAGCRCCSSRWRRGPWSPR